MLQYVYCHTILIINRIIMHCTYNFQFFINNNSLYYVWGLRGGVIPCCRHIIAEYVPHIPWIEDLLGTFLSFCPIESQNPTLVHIVSVLP
jgi:hypothetical protein